MRFLLVNSRHALLRRLLALAVVLLPVPGSAFSLTVPASAAHCGERVCRCAHHCPMSRKPAKDGPAAKPSCHEEAPVARTFWRPGACGTAQTSSEAPPPVRPHVAEPSFVQAPAASETGLRPADRAAPVAGFRDVPLQPPRANA